MEAALLILAVWGFFPVLAKEKIPVDQSFDIKKFYGKWYPVTTVHLTSPKWRTSFPFTIRASPNNRNTIEMIVEYPRDEKCYLWKREMQVSGVGTFKSKDRNMNSYIVETDNDKYVIFYDQKGDETVLQLLAKKIETTVEWFSQLYFYADYLDFNPKWFSYLRKSDFCTDNMPRA